MVILAAFSILYTYTCLAPSPMPEGQSWGSNTFSPAHNLSNRPWPRQSDFGVGCWHSTTPHTTTSTDHLQPRKRVRTKPSHLSSLLLAPLTMNPSPLPPVIFLLPLKMMQTFLLPSTSAASKPMPSAPGTSPRTGLSRMMTMAPRPTGADLADLEILRPPHSKIRRAQTRTLRIRVFTSRANPAFLYLLWPCSNFE